MSNDPRHTRLGRQDIADFDRGSPGAQEVLPFAAGATAPRSMLRRRSLLLRLALLSLLAVPIAANAIDLSLKLEPGLTIPLTDPQSKVYGIGGSESLKLLFRLNRYLDIGPTVSFTYLPASASEAQAGIVWAFGGGLRLKRPHDSEGFYGISPWLDADLFYMRTGPLNRPGFDAAVGLAFPIGENRTFWLGPFVRYTHVMQLDRAGYDNHDAKLLVLGVSFEVDSGLPRAPAEERIVNRDVPRDVIVNHDVEVCSDSDGDDIPDNIDHCPEVKGPMDNWGCPNYPKLTVKRDKLELKEKLYFAWDQAKLEEASFPALDDVVQALKDNKGFRVQVEGHADSSGGDDHNQTLSEKRAEAVLDYLAAHGISKDRLISKGFSSSVPIDTNATVEGRENNRRVEFVVHFIIVKPGSAK